MTGFNNGFNFNNPTTNNPLMELLRQYMPQQQQSSTPEPVSEPTRNASGFNVYEINAKSDIEYIEQDKSGRMQVYVCPNEKRIYTSRYNHVKKEPDYKAFIEEEEVNLFQKPDTSAEMSQIATALVAVVNKLESMDSVIHEIKNTKPAVVEKVIEKHIETPVQATPNPNRNTNGQFKKKGDK